MTKTITTTNWSPEELARDYGFEPVRRLTYRDFTQSDIDAYENGIPLIISDWHLHPEWNPNFNIEFFVNAAKATGKHQVHVRNVRNASDFNMDLDEFIYKCKVTSVRSSATETERLYAKDAPCPADWGTWLHSGTVIPSQLLPEGNNNTLMSLHKADRPETLMCYLGIGDTFTPFHKDLCASSGHNLMCYTEAGGSSFWFMSEGSAAPDVAKYFYDKFRSELDSEDCIPTPEQLKGAPFKIYVAEQKLGDLVLVPPRSAHQVVNNLGLTVKTSWSRMTLRGLEQALYYELPIYRRVCRPETYRTKITLHHDLHRQAMDFQRAQQLPVAGDASTISCLSTSSLALTDIPKRLGDLHRTIKLFDFVLQTDGPMHNYVPNSILPTAKPLFHGPLVEAEIILKCDFCAGDVFNSFFECSRCRYNEEGIVICPGCYLEGRNCGCRKASPKMIKPFSALLDDRKRAVEVFIQHSSNLPLHTLAAYHLQDQESLIEKSRSGIFANACRLFENTKTQEWMKCQGFKRSNTHRTRGTWIFRCDKGCHAAVCLHHLLTLRNIHVLDAFNVYWQDEDHMKFHHFHQQKASSQVYEQNIETLMQLQRSGIAYPELGDSPSFHGMLLTYIARNTCAAHFDEKKPIKAGFYDSPAADSDIFYGASEPSSPSAVSPAKTAGKKRKREEPHGAGPSKTPAKKTIPAVPSSISRSTNNSLSASMTVSAPPVRSANQSVSVPGQSSDITLQSIFLSTPNGVSNTSMSFGIPNFGPTVISGRSESQSEDELLWPDSPFVQKDLPMEVEPTPLPVFLPSYGTPTPVSEPQATVSSQTKMVPAAELQHSSMGSSSLANATPANINPSVDVISLLPTIETATAPSLPPVATPPEAGPSKEPTKVAEKPKDAQLSLSLPLPLSPQAGPSSTTAESIPPSSSTPAEQAGPSVSEEFNLTKNLNKSYGFGKQRETGKLDMRNLAKAPWLHGR